MHYMIEGGDSFFANVITLSVCECCNLPWDRFTVFVLEQGDELTVLIIGRFFCYIALYAGGRMSKSVFFALYNIWTRPLTTLRS